ncbi:hypothetical protein BH11PSE8_BH11PSE8_12550 [soil metagenome]
MFVSSRIAANAVLLAASVGASAAMAQQAASSSATAPKAAASSAPSTSAAPASASPMAYRSVFEGYKGLAEQPLQPWRESNDTVRRIGGWMSYAREGQGGPVAASDPASGSTGMADMPGMSGMPADHGGMNMPSSAGGSSAPLRPAAGTPAPGRAPAMVPPAKSRAAAGSASHAMPADHTGHTKP